MIKIITKSTFENIVKFNHQDYLLFLDDDFNSNEDYFGYSIQVKEYLYTFKKLLEVLEILIFNNKSDWVILHDDKVFPWFKTLKLKNDFPVLFQLFKEYNIKYNSRSILYCENSFFNLIGKELIKYPSVLSYKNIDCINIDYNYIIKITSHKTIDIISSNPKLVNKLVNKLKPINGLIKIKYNSTK